MPRPRLFDETRRQINVYMHNDQYQWLITQAKAEGTSPSALMRLYIDAARGVDRDKIGPQGTNKLKEENL